MTERTYLYGWRNNAERKRLFGRPCVVEARGTKNSVLLRFTDGQAPERTVTSRYAIKRAYPPAGIL